MLSVQRIKNMCEAPMEEKAYYRPIICKGEVEDIDIFFVGTNPATPIYPKDMSLDAYVDLLMNYDRFINYYKQSRIKNGKPEISRTRIGMNSFLGWLSNITDSAVGETEVVPYPTENLKLLKKEPLDIIERGKEMFYELLMELKPRLLILHGKKTVEYSMEILVQKGVLSKYEVNLDLSIEQMERQLPLYSFKYPNGKIANIMVCRHFMYYGSTGNSFREFKDNIQKILNDESVKDY